MMNCPSAPCPSPPRPSPHTPPALYQKKNGVSALYFLLRETSDGLVDGRIHLIKTCVVHCRRGPCTALGCHGNRCTCRFFSFSPDLTTLWLTRPSGWEETCPACVSVSLSGCFCCNMAKKTSPKIKSFFFFWCKGVLAKWCLLCIGVKPVLRLSSATSRLLSVWSLSRLDLCSLLPAELT